METLSPFKGYIGILSLIMENQMEKKIENEMEAPGPFKGVYRNIQGFYP